MKILLIVLFAIGGSVYAASIKKFTFARTGVGCAGIDLRMNVVNNKAYLSIFKECLMTEGKRTEGKTHRKLKVKDGAVYFYDVFCGYIQSDGSVNVSIAQGRDHEEGCYLDNTDNFIYNRYFLKAKVK
ncbi:MAG: hypothetical protein N4A33_02150 [Bacteriovoracaceae bacterium]|jgi:hypothetical protein|nr:hypothetical protein [Bacteriovoracaceae bacterium]